MNLIMALFILLATPLPPLVHQIASIVRGEAPHGCAECYAQTACQVARDIERRGTSVAYDRNRWKGWRDARSQPDIINVAYQALSSPDFCAEYPVCRRVGSLSDLAYWQREFKELSATGWCNEYGCTFCVIEPEPNEDDRHFRSWPHQPN